MKQFDESMVPRPLIDSSDLRSFAQAKMIKGGAKFHQFDDLNHMTKKDLQYENQR